MVIVVINVASNEKVVSVWIKNVLGNRVYDLNSPNEIPHVSRVILDFDGFKDEKNCFHDLRKDGTVEVNLHKCPKFEGKIRYVWQGKGATKDRLPTTCPRCHRRLDLELKM